MPVDFLSLPVYQHKDVILKALEENQVVIIESPTGSGKTTQLPLILREAGYDKKGIIGITQPRRIATLSISSFIKKQLGCINNYVAYTMRFADTSDEETRIKVMTDGILLQELKQNPNLENYSVIMVDEAHERSLNIDFILGLLKEIIENRKDLKVVISSATINTSTFSAFFGNAPIISIKARTFPVEVKYKTMKIERDFEDIYYEKIENLIVEDKKENPGDVLVFLSGEADIKGLVESLTRSENKDRWQVYPLYGRLSKEDQEKVFTPTKRGKTKIVVATNIAETSITIDGITTVIDSGLAKINFYNQRNFTNTLSPIPISRSSADQRKGRAGRTQSGVCYRLYSEKDYLMRPEYSEEEILHSDLAEVMLRMSELGIYNYTSFPFITRPKTSAFQSAEETLMIIGAIEKDHRLTKIGEMMIKYPLLPRLERIIVESILSYPSVLDEVLVAVSFLSTRQPYILPIGKEMEARSAHRTFQSKKWGDFVSMQTLYKTYVSIEGKKERENFAKKYFLDIQTLDEIVNIHDQLSEEISKEGIPILSGGSIDDYFRCIISGLRQYVAKKKDARSYKTISADDIYIHPGSAWFNPLPEYIIAGEVVKTTKMYARTVSPILKAWVNDIDPALLKTLSGKAYKEEGEKGKRKEKSARRKPTAEEIIASFPLSREKGKKKNVRIITLSELKAIGNISSDQKFRIKVGKSLSKVPVRMEDIDHELKLMKEMPVLKENFPSSLDPHEDVEVIISLFKFLFAPYQMGKDSFGYLGFSEKDGKYTLRPFIYIDEAVESTLDSLYSIIGGMDKKNEKRKRISMELDKIEAALS